MGDPGPEADLTEHISRLCEERLFALGVQVSVAAGGTTPWTSSVGESSHGPMTDGTLHQVWCLCKPITAMVAMRALEAAGVGLEAELDGLGPTPLAVPEGATVRHLLEHDLGAHRPTASDIRMAPRHRRRSLVAERAVEPLRPAYSELVAWSVLSDIVADVAGTSLEDATQRALDAAGLDIHIQIDDERYDSIQDRIGCYFWLDGMRPVPLIHDTVRGVATESSAALGGYATIESITRWYRLLHAARQGSAGIPSGLFPSEAQVNGVLGWTERRREDEVMGRDCQFAAGFMVDLARHGLGRSMPTGSYGHAGWVGTSFTVAVPDGGVGSALVNVVGFEESDLQGWRPQLARLVLRAALGGAV